MLISSLVQFNAASQSVSSSVRLNWEYQPSSHALCNLEHTLITRARWRTPSMRQFISALVIATFCASGPAVFAQTGAKDETKKAGAAAKEAGKDTADAAKHVGKATAKATTKGAKKVGGATKDAVQRTYTCADGTTDHATLKANACKDHGGIKVEAKAKS